MHVLLSWRCQSAQHVPYSNLVSSNFSSLLGRTSFRSVFHTTFCNSQSSGRMAAHLDRLHTYFRERDRKKVEAAALDASNERCTGVPIMSPEEICLSCIENDGYETPELNDKLYLHFRGFRYVSFAS